MRYCRIERFLSVALMLAASLMFAKPAWAGIFSKHSKINPAERVPALIASLRAEPDERKRTAAAEELRQYDPSMFPEIIPSLADAAQHDPKSGVRMEAIQSLAKLRPVSQRAGAAIEQATHDDSMRVRLQARTLLWQYHLAGYHGSKTPDIGVPATTIHTEEPPLAAQPEPAPISTFQIPVAPEPTVGYVSPAPPELKRNVWGATTSPSVLPAQPKAVPIEPRPLSSGPAQVRASGPKQLPSGPTQPLVSGPKPLPSGPAKPLVSGPKPLPSGPVETGKPTGEGTSKETPPAPQKEDGPELP